MKFSIVPLTVACTGLLASASPLRVIMISSSVQTSESGPVAQLKPIQLHPAQGGVTKQRVPCGARLRQKASSISDAFKIALGFTVSHKDGKPEANIKHFTPVPFIGTPNPNSDKLRIVTQPQVVHHYGHGHGQGHRFHQSGEHSFLMRVHFALMSLGPWEGRAVAFVLGCGIGVLLRMFWVMMVVSYRMIKGRSSSEQEHEYTVVDIMAEEILVGPPQYTYPVDEKVDIVEPIAVPVESK
ncbi:hypothetical protein B0H19DRAFT_1247325 [Mycena capillaripes]|nr:hypothetical protein B0H19DRAFT_1247325 [Mycena capillaripes]